MKQPKSNLAALQITLIAICALLLMPYPLLAAGGSPFTADHISTSPDGSQVMKGKIYASKDKLRMDMKQPGMPGEMVVLHFKKSQKAVLIMQATKRYFEMPADKNMFAGFAELKESQKKKLGTEKVNGYRCTKYAVTKQIEIMGQQQTINATVWESKDFGYPIKSQTKEGGIQELRNIKTGEPPARLFKIPSGYKKAANMMELMMPNQ